MKGHSHDHQAIQTSTTLNILQDQVKKFKRFMRKNNIQGNPSTPHYVRSSASKSKRLRGVADFVLPLPKIMYYRVAKGGKH